MWDWGLIERSRTCWIWKTRTLLTRISTWAAKWTKSNSTRWCLPSMIGWAILIRRKRRNTFFHLLLPTSNKNTQIRCNSKCASKHHLRSNQINLVLAVKIIIIIIVLHTLLNKIIHQVWKSSTNNQFYQRLLLEKIIHRVVWVVALKVTGKNNNFKPYPSKARSILIHKIVQIKSKYLVQVGSLI